MKARIQNLLLLLASVLLTVALAECGLRYHHYRSVRGLSGEHTLRMPDPVRGWVLEPGRSAFQRTRDYGVHVQINDKGLRDRPHDYEPAPGTFRIVVLGDSFMEAYQVPLEASLPYRLQEELSDRKVEVMNLGVGGYGTAQAYLALRDEGLRYRPDLVVLAFFAGNDLLNNSRPLQRLLYGDEDPQVFARPYATARSLDGPVDWTPPDAVRMAPYIERWKRKRYGLLDQIRRWLQPSVLANVIERGLASIRARSESAPGLDPNVIYGWPFLAEFAPDYATVPLPEYASMWQEAWLDTRALLLETSRLVRSQGARFVVMLVPVQFQTDPEFLAEVSSYYPGVHFDVTRINRELERFCNEHGIAWVDPTPAFARAGAEGRQLFHHIEDRHWNDAGHALALQVLVGELDRRGLIPPPAG